MRLSMPAVQRQSRSDVCPERSNRSGSVASRAHHRKSKKFCERLHIKIQVRGLSLRHFPRQSILTFARKCFSVRQHMAVGQPRARCPFCAGQCPYLPPRPPACARSEVTNAMAGSPDAGLNRHPGFHQAWKQAASRRLAHGLLCFHDINRERRNVRYTSSRIGLGWTYPRP